MTGSAGRRPGFRLIDGVIVAAVALLGLKILGLVSGSGTEAEDPPPFGRVMAHARTNYVPGDPITTGSVPAKKEEPPKAEAAVKEPPPAPAPPLFPPSASEQALLSRLGDRREELQQRARDIDAREKLIQEQERRLDERALQAKATEEAEKGSGRKPEDEGSGLKNLVVMYESMKAKEAARVFERLPLDILVPVVTRMNARKMSEVLAAMSPESAEKLTVALTKRAGAPPGDKGQSAGGALPPGELPAIGPLPVAPRR